MRYQEFAISENWLTDKVSGMFSGGFTVKLPVGKRGTAVRDLQQALQALGFNVGPHGFDGIIGPDTQGAIFRYQSSKGLPTGNVTQDMVNAINTDLKAKPELIKQLAPSTNAQVKSGPVGRGTGQLKPLAQDAVTKGKVGQVLNFVASFESRGNYNMVIGGGINPNLTKMTIAQVYNLQKQLLAQGKESSAVGRYQFVGRTLRECVAGLGLDPNTAIFDPQTQDALIIYRLRAIRGMDKWLAGQINDTKFLNNLSQEFASMPSPAKGGSSYHAGVGSNKSLTDLQTALNTLSDIKSA